jgi:hypothetical protein
LSRRQRWLPILPNDLLYKPVCRSDGFLAIEIGVLADLNQYIDLQAILRGDSGDGAGLQQPNVDLTRIKVDATRPARTTGNRWRQCDISAIPPKKHQNVAITGRYGTRRSSVVRKKSKNEKKPRIAVGNIQMRGIHYDEIFANSPTEKLWVCSPIPSGFRAVASTIVCCGLLWL